MFGLLKKDLFRSTVHVAVLLPMAAAYWVLTADRLHPGMVLMLGGLFYVFIIGAVFIGEQEEDKNHGYAFLRALPLTVREIVAAKFAMPLLVAVFVGICSFVLFSRFPGAPRSLAFSRVFILMNGALSLIMAGVLYIGIYRFGYLRFIKGFLVGAMVAGFVPQIILFEFRAELRSLDLGQLVDALARIDPLWIVACGLALYGGLMMVAIRVKGTAAGES